MLEIARKIFPWRRYAREAHSGFQRVQKRLEREGAISETLQSEVFGEKQSRKFVDQIIQLEGITDSFGMSKATVIDKKEDKRIGFLRGKFPEEGPFVSVQNDSRNSSNYVYDTIRYIVDPETRKRRPYLTSHDDNLAPYNRHISYIAGDLGEPCFEGYRISEKNKFLSDEEMRSFCMRVFNLYLSSQNKRQPQPQNSLG